MQVPPFSIGPGTCIVSEMATLIDARFVLLKKQAAELASAFEKDAGVSLGGT